MKKTFEKTLAAFAASALFLTAVPPVFGQEPSSPPGEVPVVNESNTPVQEAENPAEDAEARAAILKDLNALKSLVDELDGMENLAGLVDPDNPEDIKAVTDFLYGVNTLKTVLYGKDYKKKLGNLDDAKDAKAADDDSAAVINAGDMNDKTADEIKTIFEKFFTDAMNSTYCMFDRFSNWAPYFPMSW